MTDRTIAELEIALKTAREQGNAEAEIGALTGLGSLLQKSRQLAQAASCFLQARKRVEDGGSPKDRAVVLAGLGCVYWEMAQLKKAMTLLDEARNLAKQCDDATGQAVIAAFLGISYWRKCQWREAVACFKEALAMGRSFKPAGAVAGRERYASLQEAMERGVATLQNRIRLGREQRDPLKILQPLFSMIPLFLFTGRESEMESLLWEAIPLAEQSGKTDMLDVIPELRNLRDHFNR